MAWTRDQMAARAAQELERHRDDRGLPGRARHRDGAVGGDEVGEQLAAVEDRQAELARRDDVGHGFLDRKA